MSPISEGRARKDREIKAPTVVVLENLGLAMDKLAVGESSSAVDQEVRVAIKQMDVFFTADILNKCRSKDSQQLEDHLAVLLEDVQTVPGPWQKKLEAKLIKTKAIVEQSRSFVENEKKQNRNLHLVKIEQVAQDESAIESSTNRETADKVLKLIEQGDYDKAEIYIGVCDPAALSGSDLKGMKVPQRLKSLEGIQQLPPKLQSFIEALQMNIMGTVTMYGEEIDVSQAAVKGGEATIVVPEALPSRESMMTKAIINEMAEYLVDVKKSVGRGRNRNDAMVDMISPQRMLKITKRLEEIDFSRVSADMRNEVGQKMRDIITAAQLDAATTQGVFGRIFEKLNAATQAEIDAKETPAITPKDRPDEKKDVVVSPLSSDTVPPLAKRDTTPQASPAAPQTGGGLKAFFSKLFGR